MSDGKIKVIIPPEVLADLEQHMSPEELAEFVAQIQQMAESGELEEQSTPIDFSTLEEDDPQMFAMLTEKMREDGFSTLEEWSQAQIDRIHHPDRLH